MKVFVSLPLEILGDNLTQLWDHLKPRIQDKYPSAKILCNYTGEGTIEESDAVVFLYEFKDTKSCKDTIKRCNELDKPYSFFLQYYSPRFYYR